MQFSTSIEYAIHGLVYLAVNGSETATLVGDVATAIKVPDSYLRKVFQLLVRGGLVTSQRGAKGGFVLARDPARITLKDVVEAIDGSLPLYTCMKAKRKCSALEACPVSAAFEEARNKMAEVLGGTTLESLAKGISHRAVGWLKVTECA
jgi:Rrf2 family transcriptional regulator, iron-sulfur cluster assembly transcription factor